MQTATKKFMFYVIVYLPLCGEYNLGVSKSRLTMFKYLYAFLFKMCLYFFVFVFSDASCQCHIPAHEVGNT